MAFPTMAEGYWWVSISKRTIQLYSYKTNVNTRI